MAEQIAVNYHDEFWGSKGRNPVFGGRQSLELRITEDVRAELTNLAALFRRRIIGKNTARAPTITMSTVAKGSGQPNKTYVLDWATRNSNYLERKRDATGSSAWFDNTGWHAEDYPGSEPGLTARTFKGNSAGPGSADVWEDIFGKVSVDVRRARGAGGPQAAITGPKTGTHLKVQLATVYVRALGNLNFPLTPRSITAALETYDPELANRFGRMRNGVYRPTFEPFLDFFLNQAMSHAVNTRLQKGNFGSVFRK